MMQRHRHRHRIQQRMAQSLVLQLVDDKFGTLRAIALRTKMRLCSNFV